MRVDHDWLHPLTLVKSLHMSHVACVHLEETQRPLHAFIRCLTPSM